MDVKRAAGLCKQDFVCDIGTTLIGRAYRTPETDTGRIFSTGSYFTSIFPVGPVFILGHEGGLKTGLFQNYYCETKTISRSFDFYGWQHFTSITLGVSVWLNIIRP